jgi:hypothetical protein
MLKIPQEISTNCKNSQQPQSIPPIPSTEGIHSSTQHRHTQKTVLKTTKQKHKIRIHRSHNTTSLISMLMTSPLCGEGAEGKQHGPEPRHCSMRAQRPFR